MWSLFLITFFIFSSLQAQVENAKFSNLIHQSMADYPCWEVIQPELKALIQQADKCGVQVSQKDQLLSRPTTMAAISREIIFDLAAQEHQNDIQCMRSAFKSLAIQYEKVEGNEKERNLYTYWSKNTASLLASVILHEGEAAQFKIKQALKDREIKRLAVQPGKGSEVIALQSKFGTDHQAEAQVLTSLASETRESIPFIQNPYVRNYIQQISSKLFGDTPENYPTHFTEIHQKIEAEIRSSSKTFFTNLEKSLSRDSMDDEYRVELLKNGFVAKALQKVSSPESALYKKLYNCAEGNYGDANDRVELTKTSLGMALGGFGRNLPKAQIGKFNLNNLWKFAKKVKVKANPLPTALSTLAAIPAMHGPKEIIKACLTKNNLSMPEVPPSCESKAEVESYMLKWFEGQSCITAILFNLP